MGVRHGFYIFKEMIRLAWRYNPTFLILILASSMFILALIIYINLIILYDVEYYVKILMGVMIILLGFQSLLLALLSLYIKSFEYRMMRRLAQ